jgi:BlaI family transcriptional regulator, penicillinase repressor
VDAYRGFFIVSKRPKAVTDAELAVLKALWQNGPQTARVLTQAIYPGGAESEFASVHSFLQRLERKRLVTRDRRSPVHVFSAAASQADLIGSELTALANRLGDGSIAPLIMHLVEQNRLTQKEAAEIRRLLDNHAK